jgi:succinyl-CoA synthetase beta subunit
LAELFFYFQKHGWNIKILDLSFEVLVIETEAQLDVNKIQKEMGGIVKILKVIDEVGKKETDFIDFALKHYFKPSKLKKDFLKNAKGKIQFGVSVYLLDQEVKAFGSPKNVGMFNKLLAIDGKINFDDNALYRHADVAAMLDPEEEDKDELLAKEKNLSFVNLYLIAPYLKTLQAEETHIHSVERIWL